MGLKLAQSLLLLLLLNACSFNTGRYQQQHDSIPTRLPSQSELQDAIPRHESPSRGGNKHYQVGGKHYRVLPSATGFTQTGIASWYGNKFHGHLTSNGEIYNMYSMSAAHKNLPLPTYLKVVNNSNQKSVIVRVNDRGPFHQDRIIDLSYSAAYKLGMLATGTADVTITAISANNQVDLARTRPTSNTLAQVAIPPTQQVLAPTTVPSPTSSSVLGSVPENSGRFIQVFATRNEALAVKTARGLAQLYQQQASAEEKNGIFRVQLGPFNIEAQLTSLLETLKETGYPSAFALQVP